MKQKTDWMWVIQMLTLGALGVAMCYHAKVTGMLWEKIDRLELEVVGIENTANLPLHTEELICKSNHIIDDYRVIKDKFKMLNRTADKIESKLEGMESK